MNKHFNSENIIFYSTILIVIGTIITLFSTFNANAFGTFFSTDTLYLPSIYKDLFVDHNPLKGWHLNPSPNIFPDMIVYFIINAITSDFVVASFAFAIVQYLFFTYLIYRLFKTIELPNPKVIAALSNLLMLMFFMVSFYSNDFGFTFYLVSNSYHTGAFLMSLLCIILTLEYFKNENSKTIIFLSIVSTLSVFSDRLFVVLYILPCITLIAYRYMIGQRKGLIKITISTIASTIVGFALFVALKKSNFVYIDEPHRIMDFKYIGECFKLLMQQMWVYIADLNFKSLILLLSLVAFGFTSVKAIKIIRRKTILNTRDSYTVLTIAYVTIVFFAPVINGNYTGFDTLRYNIYIFYLLTINLGFIIYLMINRLGHYSIKIAYGAIVILMLVASINIIKQFRNIGLKEYFTYYPKQAKSIDEVAKQEKLYCGLGNYWNTKVINMFSKEGIKVFTSIYALSPWGHVMNDNWYKNSRFNFIISDDKTQDSLINSYFNGKTRLIESGDLRVVLTPEFRINMNSYKVEEITK